MINITQKQYSTISVLSLQWILSFMIIVSCTSPKKHEEIAQTNHKPKTTIIANDTLETTGLDIISVEKRESNFKHKYFSLTCPANWNVDSLSANSPSLFSAHRGSDIDNSLGLITMIYINEKHLSLEDFSLDLTENKFVTKVKNPAFIQTVQMKPYQIVRGYKETNIKKGVANFYFYQIDKEKILCLHFFGNRSTSFTKQETEKNKIIHSVKLFTSKNS